MSQSDSTAEQQSSPETTESLLDKIDARASGGVLGRQHFEAPYTRQKVLQYFRPMHYGEASVARHGGDRGLDEQMAQELWEKVYRKAWAPRWLAHKQNATEGGGDEDVRIFTMCSALLIACAGSY